MTKQVKKITDVIQKTLDDPTKWGVVLDLLIEATQCSKGTILQREIKSGLVHLPKHIPPYLSQPLLRGFTEDQLIDYEDNYAENDPWTEIEFRYPSVEPYALSSYLPYDELKQHDFYHWLAPTGVTDTVVMDIYRDSDYLIAINLFFDIGDTETRDKCIDVLQACKNAIRITWRAIQKRYLDTSIYQPMAMLMNRNKHAELLINANGTVFVANEEAKKAFDDSNFPIVIKSERLFIRNQVLRNAFWQGLQLAFDQPEKQSSFRFNNCLYKVTPLDETYDLVGIDRGIKLLSFDRQQSELSTERPIWTSDILTRRERDLVKVLSHGGRVVDFQREHDLAKSTAHNCWSNVKKKLNISDRSELVALYSIRSTNPKNELNE